LSESKLRVLVLGKTGMLGQMVYRLLRQDRRLRVAGTRMDDKRAAGYFNVLDGPRGFARLIEKTGGCDYCINCIGITANKIDESDAASVKRARAINAEFPGWLAAAASGYGCRVIHISTDGVFRGTKPGYTERSRPDCQDVYGRTKLAGEATADNFLTIRCSILGPSPHEKGGLWEWFAGLPAGARVRGYSNHYWNGVTTLQFARLCREIMVTGAFASLRKKSAVFHFTPNRTVTKYRLLEILRRVLKKKITLIKVRQGNGTVRRILRSRFRSLQKLVRHARPMEDAIRELVHYERNKHG